MIAAEVVRGGDSVRDVLSSRLIVRLFSGLGLFDELGDREVVMDEDKETLEDRVSEVVRLELRERVRLTDAVLLVDIVGEPEKESDVVRDADGASETLSERE